jgi:thioredoxin reductase (NADPH)
VYAAGDARNTPLRQVATAVGDAAIAAFEAAKYIETIEESEK